MCENKNTFIVFENLVQKSKSLVNLVEIMSFIMLIYFCKGFSDRAGGLYWVPIHSGKEGCNRFF